MWEVFNPKDGKPIYRVRFRFIARFLCYTSINKNLDYGPTGEGWVNWEDQWKAYFQKSP